jgi:lipopolysaccharide export system permease protein
LVVFRYISREFIAPFVFSLSLIIFLFVLNLLFQMLGRIAGKGLPWNTVAEFFVLNLAWMLALAVPMAVLVATLTTYGRMGADGEITALKACGVGPLRMLTPALIMGLTVALTLVIFNDRFLPDMNRRSRQLTADIKRKKPTMILEPGVFMSDIPGNVLIAREVNQDSSELGDVFVYQDNDPEFSTTVSASRGKLRYDEAAEGFQFALTQGQIERVSKKRNAEFQITQFDSAVFRISAPEMSLKRTDTNWRGDREMNVSQLLARIQEYRQRDSVAMAKDIGKLQVEVHKKFSIPAACIVFALLGMVVGQWVKKSGLGVSAGYSIFFFLIYWVFLIGGEDFADRGRVAPWIAMWAPNVLFGSVALFLFWRERRGAAPPSLGPLFARLRGH